MTFSFLIKESQNSSLLTLHLIFKGPLRSLIDPTVFLLLVLSSCFSVKKLENETWRMVWLFIRPFHYPEDHGGVKPEELSPLAGPNLYNKEQGAAEVDLFASSKNVRKI